MVVVDGLAGRDRALPVDRCGRRESPNPSNERDHALFNGIHCWKLAMAAKETMVMRADHAALLCRHLIHA